jgi:hypothetical protein
MIWDLELFHVEKYLSQAWNYLSSLGLVIFKKISHSEILNFEKSKSVATHSNPSYLSST